MVIMRNSSTGSPHFAQSNCVRQKFVKCSTFKTDQHNQYHYAKDMPVGPQRHIGAAQDTATAYLT